MHVLHVFDSTCGWEQRLALTQLLDRLDPKIVETSVASIDPKHTSRLLEGIEVFPCPRRLSLPTLAAPAIRSLCLQNSCDIIHAWGAPAATASRAALPDSAPIVTTVFDPGLAQPFVRMLLAAQQSGNLAVACSTERVRRRMVEQGIDFDACAVIRPGVNFKTIGAVDRNKVRAELGIPHDSLVAITPDPPSQRGCHRTALWSVLMRTHLGGDTRLIVPGRSSTTADLRRFAACSENPPAVIFACEGRRFEELLPATDVLIYAAIEDVSTTAIAWAMASSVTIVSPATYCVAEMLANDLNAILFKAEDYWTRRGRQICAKLDSAKDASKIREVARGQAYEVFSLRRTVDQHRQLYENLLNQDPPATNITDAATVAVDA
ncbi:MAG: glycosyltransferase [Planctomycetes bacterium]|nr:glycosyltransferase [Planctomycetota bacterium]